MAKRKGKYIKKYTAIPITKIANDKEKKKFFFLFTDGKGNVKRYENVNFEKLEETRNNIFLREERKLKNKFKSEIPTDKIKILKKSSDSSKRSDIALKNSSGNIELQQLRKKIILEAKIKGLGELQILELIANEFGTTPSFISSEIRQVEEYIRSEAIVLHEEILLSHLTKYEYLYAKFKEEGVDGYALKALKCKENVMGLHDQTVNIQVNNYMDSEFSFNVLSKEKKERLIQLLMKIRVT